MDTKVTRALLSCPLFKGFTADDLAVLMPTVSSRLVRFDKNDIYALAGTPCRYADIIVEGELTARMVGASGKLVQLSSLQAGSLVAPSFIFAENNKMPVSVETKMPTVVLRMTPTSLHQLLRTDERVELNFIRLLSGTSSFLARKVRLLTLQTVREKVARFLLEETRHCGGETIVLKHSRQEIADTFAVTKFSLQRCLNAFVQEGLIDISGKTISIINKRALADMVPDMG